jgi:salicylate hydroxylase
MSQVHVSIAGAGLGGLCLAQGLKRAGIGFDVYERAPSASARNEGYRIRIDADGQAALSRCLPANLDALFRATAIESSGAQFLAIDLSPVVGRAPQRWSASQAGAPSSAGPEYSIHRQTLREILLCGIEDHVHFGMPLQRFEALADDTVRIEFAGGETRTSTLLVGADGVNSTVRQQLVHDEEPYDTGALCIYGKSPATTALKASVGALLCEGTSVIFADGFAAIVDPMLFAGPLPSLAARLAPGCRLTPVDDYLYWAIIGPRANLGIAALAAPGDPAACIEAITRTWHPQLRALFSSVDLTSISMLPVRSASPSIARWQPGPVTLLGDAIHAMSPAAGAGANTALRDAAALASAASDALSLREAVARYEPMMRAWGAAAIEDSEHGARLLAGRHSFHA